jgi:hypothetical protein
LEIELVHREKSSVFILHYSVFFYDYALICSLRKIKLHFTVLFFFKNLSHNNKPSLLPLWSFTLKLKKKIFKLDVVAHNCSLSYLEDWVRRISWVWKFKASLGNITRTHLKNFFVPLKVEKTKGIPVVLAFRTLGKRIPSLRPAWWFQGQLKLHS